MVLLHPCSPMTDTGPPCGEEWRAFRIGWEASHGLELRGATAGGVLRGSLATAGCSARSWSIAIRIIDLAKAP